jgi:hypothetical protein
MLGKCFEDGSLMELAQDYDKGGFCYHAELPENQLVRRYIVI